MKVNDINDCVVEMFALSIGSHNQERYDLYDDSQLITALFNILDGHTISPIEDIADIALELSHRGIELSTLSAQFSNTYKKTKVSE